MRNHAKNTQIIALVKSFLQSGVCQEYMEKTDFSCLLHTHFLFLSKITLGMSHFPACIAERNGP